MKRYLLFAMFCLSFIGINAQSYKELYEKAMKYENIDSLNQAEKYYKQALKIDPSNVHNGMIFANMARTQRSLKRFDDAAQSYDYAANLLPRSIPILMDRAFLSLEMGKIDKAYLDYCTVLDIDKKNIDALLNRAYLEYSKGNYKESLSDYNRLLEIEPHNKAAKIGLVVLFQREKKCKEALELINSLVITTLDDAELYALRAAIEKDLNYIDLSLNDLDKAILLVPNYANAYLLRGEILLLQNKKDQAKINFEKAIEFGFSRADLQEQLKSCK